MFSSKYETRIRKHFNSQEIEGMTFKADNVVNYKFYGANYNIENTVELSGECSDITIKFTIAQGKTTDASVGLEFIDNEWSKDNYLLVPAAVYNGNRYKVAYKSYPPALTEQDEIGLNMPVTITDVPHLNIDEGTSQIQLKAADMATPAVCVYNPHKKRGFILLFPHKTQLGYNGVTITEDDNRTTATLIITAPAVRQLVKYSMCTTSAKSEDRGVTFTQGDEITLKVKAYEFPCDSIQGLYDYLFNIRYELETDHEYNNEITYSSAMNLFLDKYNKENWKEQGGYYSVGTDDNIYQDFQSGWVGGGMNIYPLYAFGDKKTKERAKQCFNYIIDKVQAESGFFYGVCHKGKLYGDFFYDIDRKGVLLLRKNADMLYFLIRTYTLIKENEPDCKDLIKYEKSICKSCDAFVRLWERYGQWGQFIDIEKEEIIIGNTASAGAGVGALALAYQVFGQDKYLATAKQVGKYYYDNFTKIGLTNGGPGEICQTPDSESAFALLESYVVMYETTGDTKWLQAAKDSASQASTWCVTYNFEFPKNSEFGKLGIKTIGSVYANCQNKHSAPGICTFSGDSLLKLYRFTGDIRYLDLITEIAHNITQYISRNDKPIHDNNGIAMPSGYVNERVNMCDWEGGDMVGGVFYGSCWCECSAMLTVSDIPSVYIDPQKGIVRAFDNIKAKLENGNLILHNPTKFSGEIRIFIEQDLTANLVSNFNMKLSTITIESNESLTIAL